MVYLVQVFSFGRPTKKDNNSPFVWGAVRIDQFCEGKAVDIERGLRYRHFPIRVRYILTSETYAKEAPKEASHTRGLVPMAPNASRPSA